MIRRPNVLLVGAGVVGQAILRAHINAGVAVWIADQDQQATQDAVAAMNLDSEQWQVSQPVVFGDRWPAIEMTLPLLPTCWARPVPNPPLLSTARPDGTRHEGHEHAAGIAGALHRRRGLPT